MPSAQDAFGAGWAAAFWPARPQRSQRRAAIFMGIAHAPLWGTTEDEKPCLGPVASGRRDWPAGRRRSKGPNAAALFSWECPHGKYRQHAAIDGQIDSRDKIRVRRCQEENSLGLGLGLVAGPPPAAQGYVLGRSALFVEPARRQGNAAGARSHRVNADLSRIRWVDAPVSV